MFRKLMRFSIKHLLRLLVYGTIGALLLAITAFVLYVNSQPDLEPWHRAPLESEFRADAGVKTFAEYLELEERLFAELDAEVLQKASPSTRFEFDRFSSGSMSDPARWSRNWNRTFELEQDAPEAGVLLLHGMSDSPYSLRELALHLHESGAWVIGLRIPGHGTAPVGLTQVTWQDMAAAVRLAVLHLREHVGDKPLHIAGYSNGGALAVNYALQTLEDDALPRPQSLALISPEIGIAAAAALASWQARLGRWLGLEKLAWTSVLPEYDPFKYQSFAVNAAEQAYTMG